MVEGDWFNFGPGVLGDLRYEKYLELHKRLKTIKDRILLNELIELMKMRRKKE